MRAWQEGWDVAGRTSQGQLTKDYPNPSRGIKSGLGKGERLQWLVASGDEWCLHNACPRLSAEGTPCRLPEALERAHDAANAPLILTYGAPCPPPPARQRASPSRRLPLQGGVILEACTRFLARYLGKV